MKKSTASYVYSGAICLLLSGGALLADELATSSGDAASTAKSLQQNAQSHLEALKSEQGDQGASSARGLALQAQKAAADTAVSAHQTAKEWTDHAQSMAQAADKMNGSSPAGSAQPQSTAAAIGQAASSTAVAVKDKVGAAKESVAESARRRWSK